MRTQLGGYHDAGGVAVATVVPGTPAEQAGIQNGDVIQSINGKPINSASAFTSVISAMKPGAPVTLRIWSQGTRKTVQATLAEQPAEVYLRNQQQQNP